VGLISLSHDDEFFHCNVYADPPYCSDYLTVTTDETDAFSIDAGTPPFPIPASDATVADTPEATDASSDRCSAARTALRKKQQQMKKLKAQRRSTQKRKRKLALTKQIKKTKRGIANSRAVIVEHC
jgi:hypothetical protein